MPARTMLGQVRYSLRHEGFNLLRFITTKRPEFALEQEVRAFVWDLAQSPRNPYRRTPLLACLTRSRTC